MIKNIFKKIIVLKYKQNLDARFWIQKALLYKNFKITSKSNIYLPGYIAHAFNPSRKTIIKAILENSKIAGKDIAKKLFSI